MQLLFMLAETEEEFRVVVGMGGKLERKAGQSSDHGLPDWFHFKI